MLNRLAKSFTMTYYNQTFNSEIQWRESKMCAREIPGHLQRIPKRVTADFAPPTSTRLQEIGNTWQGPKRKTPNPGNHAHLTFHLYMKTK